MTIGCHAEVVCICEVVGHGSTPLVCVMKTARGQNVTVGIKALDVISTRVLVRSRMSRMHLCSHAETHNVTCARLL